MGITIQIKNDSDYQSICFVTSSPKPNYHYIKAVLTRIDGKTDKVRKVIFDNSSTVLSSSKNPIPDNIYSRVASVLDKKDSKFIVITRKDSEVLVDIRESIK